MEQDLFDKSVALLIAIEFCQYDMQTHNEGKNEEMANIKKHEVRNQGPG